MKTIKTALELRNWLNSFPSEQLSTAKLDIDTGVNDPDANEEIFTEPGQIALESRRSQLDGSLIISIYSNAMDL